MKNADDIRTDAIALLVEKLREIGAEADRETKRHREAEKSPAALADFRTFADHRETAALNYDLAYRCEQLIEAITVAPLFDELDADNKAAMAVEHVDYAEAEDVRQIEEEMALEAAGVDSWEDL